MREEARALGLKFALHLESVFDSIDHPEDWSDGIMRLIEVGVLACDDPAQEHELRSALVFWARWLGFIEVPYRFDGQPPFEAILQQRVAALSAKFGGHINVYGLLRGAVLANVIFVALSQSDGVTERVPLMHGVPPPDAAPASFTRGGQWQGYNSDTDSDEDSDDNDDDHFTATPLRGRSAESESLASIFRVLFSRPVAVAAGVTSWLARKNAFGIQSITRRWGAIKGSWREAYSAELPAHMATPDMFYNHLAVLRHRTDAYITAVGLVIGCNFGSQVVLDMLLYGCMPRNFRILSAQLETNSLVWQRNEVARKVAAQPDLGLVAMAISGYCETPFVLQLGAMGARKQPPVQLLQLFLQFNHLRETGRYSDTTLLKDAQLMLSGGSRKLVSRGTDYAFFTGASPSGSSIQDFLKEVLRCTHEAALDACRDLPATLLVASSTSRLARATRALDCLAPLALLIHCAQTENLHDVALQATVRAFPYHQFSFPGL